MWKSIGSLPSPTNKGKDQSTYEPFAQASRLKLNQSQLSGQSSPKFMQHYFSKKRSPESQPQRAQSQKSLEIFPLHSPPSSQHQISSPKFKPKPASIIIPKEEEHSVFSVEKLLAQESVDKVKVQSEQILKYSLAQEQLKQVKEDQLKLKKNLQNDLSAMQKMIKETSSEILGRLADTASQIESKKKEGVNPEVLSRIKQESARFNEKMKDIELRKEQVKERYRAKLAK